MRQFPKILAACACALALFTPAFNAHAAPVEALYTFLGGADGSVPTTGVIRDDKGNLFGTTWGGGTSGLGTVFKLAPDGKQTVLYSFWQGSYGEFSSWPSGLALGKGGVLFGITGLGGNTCGRYTCGTVFALAPDGTKTTLHAFNGASDGALPSGAPLVDEGGYLYGTTQYGGGHGDCGHLYCGTVYAIAPDGTETVLHSFCSEKHCTDGEVPGAGLIEDKQGNLYGTTQAGGVHRGGTVFKVTKGGTETVLYSFCSMENCLDGSNPRAALTMDEAGNLYGTAIGGGASNYGVVFELAPDGTETVLHSFDQSVDGFSPSTGVVIDSAHNIYGAVSGGYYCGDDISSVYRLSPDGKEKIICLSALPVSGFIQTNGYLIGTAGVGSGKWLYKYPSGLVFKIPE